MGVTPLSRYQWFLACVVSGISSSIGAIIWHILFVQVSLHFMPLLVTGSIVGGSLLLLSFLIWTRLLFAHLLWLKEWIFGAPLVLSSMVLLPLTPFISIPLVWNTSFLFALWGYYRCFYPVLGLETNLHTARFTKRHELATLYSRQPEETSLLLGINHWYSLFRRFVVVRKTKMRVKDQLS